jgi:uncharacterized membrane protein
MLPKFLNWREFFSIRCFHLIGKRARAHATAMISTFVGLLIAGIFTFVPDRLMYRVFFGS